MRRDLIRQWGVIISFVLVIVVNGLANALPINGQQTGEISDRFPVFFVPAGYVFSIWGLIYLGLLAFAAYQALPGQRDNERLRRVGAWFVVSCAANVAWIFLWHYNLFSLSLAVMLVLLISLVAIYLRLEIGRAVVATAERWAVHAPFSVYLGWITVATVANATDVLYDVGWGGWGIAPEAWAVVMMAIATGIGLGVLATRRDIAYALVLVWAFVGIAVKQMPRALSVGVAALILAAVIVLACVVAGRRPRRWRKTGTRMAQRLRAAPMGAGSVRSLSIACIVRAPWRLVQEHRLAHHVGHARAVLLDVVHLVHIHAFDARNHRAERDVGITALAQRHHPA